MFFHIMMVFLSKMFIILLFITATLLIVIGKRNTSSNQYDRIYKQTEDRFSKLLNAIANINEKRLDALKRFSELEFYNPSEGILRNKESKPYQYLNKILESDMHMDNKDDEEVFREIICRDISIDTSVYWLLNTLDEIADNDVTKLEDYNRDKIYNKYGNVIKEVDTLRSSCCHEALKECKKSCKTARHNFCSEHDCSHKLKKKFKKACKEACKEKVNKYM